jgi:Na+-translocating ferredoxin:NAD+ oxidoreductase RnfG subunit
MIKKWISLLFISLLFTAFSIPERIEKKADKEIAKYFNTENFSKEVITISKEANSNTVSEFGKENLFKILSGNKLLGYGYIGNAPSKTATFDYLILFDKNFIISKSKVLVYREEYGGEIGSKRWLQQFEGASYNSQELKYNQDIIPISGATISVRSMTKAMNDLLQSLGYLQKKALI